MIYTPTPGLMRRLGFEDITTKEDLDSLCTCWSRKVAARHLRYVLVKEAAIPDVELVVNLCLEDGHAQLFELREIEGMGTMEKDTFCGFLPSEDFFLQLVYAVGWPDAVLTT